MGHISPSTLSTQKEQPFPLAAEAAAAEVVKSQTGPFVRFMIQINYSDPAARVNSDQIQATRITGILSGHRAENANILGGTDQNIAHYWGGGPVSHLENTREDQIRT